MRTFWLKLFFCALLFGGLDARGQDGKLPQEVRINGVEFVHVPAGWFWHVVDTADKNGDHDRRIWYRNVRIWLDGFYIAKFEARARDFKRFLESGAAKHTADYAWGEREGCSLRKRGADGDLFLVEPELDLPITHLSWNLADEFARWMGFRLPRETEWVKAARGTDQRPFPWGDEYPDDTFAAYDATASCNPSPVDSFANGRSPYGAYNMAGNVYEFVADWRNHDHDANLKDGERNPPAALNAIVQPGHPGPMKILKGGRWGDRASFLHVHGRRMEPPATAFLCYGTRFAIDEARVREHLGNGTAIPVKPR